MYASSATLEHGLHHAQLLLIGSWINQTLPNSDYGGPSNALSYHVGHIVSSQGYILKNYSFYEELHFGSEREGAAPFSALNRDVRRLQTSNAVFYNRKLYFGEGPHQGMVSHAENGTWLHLLTGSPMEGPYEDAYTDDPNMQPADTTIAQQVSIPHGASILALGNVTGVMHGAPSIPDLEPPLPIPSQGLNLDPYVTTLSSSHDYQNPRPDLTNNPNRPIQDAIAMLQPNAFMTWSVSTRNQGQAINTPYLRETAEVIDYSAIYWLLSRDGGSTFPYLAYSQETMVRSVVGGGERMFKHVSTNVLTKSSD